MLHRYLLAVVTGLALSVAVVVQPAAAIDLYYTWRTPPGTAITIGLRRETLNTSVSLEPAHGSLTITLTSLTYKPASGYSGIDAFVAQTCTSFECTTFAINVRVEGSPVVLTAASGETIPYETADGGGWRDPYHGSLTVDQSLTHQFYTSDPGFNGLDSFVVTTFCPQIIQSVADQCVVETIWVRVGSGPASGGSALPSTGVSSAPVMWSALGLLLAGTASLGLTRRGRTSTSTTGCRKAPDLSA
ncbi:MAG: LPXTG cell wall anchor domain-containing protein [Ilumatobacteraceae bacterium]